MTDKKKNKTDSNTEKTTKRKSKKVETKEELKEELNEKLGISEEKAEVKEEKHNSNAKRIGFIACLIAVLVLLFALLGGLDKNKVNSPVSTRSEFKFSEVSTGFTKDGSFVIPENWLLTNEGQAFEKKDDLLVMKAAIFAYESNDEEWNLTKQQFSENYEVGTDSLTGFDSMVISETLGEESNPRIYEYHFLYKNGTVIQLVFIDCGEEVKTTVLNGIKF